MNKDELLKRLLSIKDDGDFEMTHSYADDWLIEYIDDEEIQKAYNDIGKWYA